ncbi:gamma-glutamyltransferase [Sphingomonas sp. C3-2]|uniref:gamma-glutamyltransferase n=1 Tax=Sphingomonas sp. C3-2 TaxID=3062169 RepID=UPI00294B18BF|nr:gamma-glutamyltransferase [Sphingomonas sp. C3-2]WOK35289.1 gamma-glutamyltransferase [Sphingomonas sp. C3-2]
MFKHFLLAVTLVLSPVPALAAGGVVSSADPRATEAGREILRQGGSASDAAMAMMLALTVVEPQSSGIGGGGFLVHHDAATKKMETIDGRETAPASATPKLFMGANGKPIGFRDAFQGGHSVGVPGNIRLMAETHKRWGKIGWAKIFAPAIRLADQGYTVNKTLAGRLAMMAPLWDRFPEARAIYWEQGKPKAEGTTIRNPALAKLLRDVAQKGPDAFYTGTHGKAIVAAVSKSPVNPVPLTLADLAAYKVRDRAALCAPYRRFTVCGMGPPSSGATTILQMLGMLERFDLKAMGKDDPKSWHLIAETMMLAYADREKYLGDPDFVQVPVAGLLDRTYLASRSALISPDTSLAAYEAGTPPGAQPRTAAISGEVAGTTHFVAVDGAGNVASMTSTIEGPFGSQLIASGMFLNNELTDFTFAPEKDGAPVANRVEAGKRPLSSMAPTIVYDETGRPVLALGSAGGKRIIMHIAKTLIGYMDFGLPAAEAIALPNLYFGGDAVMIEQGSALEAKLPALNTLGRAVVAADLPSKVNAVEWTGAGWRGAADPRSEGVALAE